jgi:simple sugar transport system substrate-binding protein
MQVAMAIDKKIEIVMISFTQVDAFWQQVRDGMKAAEKALGIDATFQFGEDDLGRTVNFLESAIAAKVDGIGIMLHNPDAYDEPIRRAREAGIPVIAFNSDDPLEGKGSARMAYVGQDDYKAGLFLGEQLESLTPKPKHVAMYAEMPGFPYSQKRGGGIKEVLSKHGITTEWVDCGVESSASILSRMQAYLLAHPETTHTVALGSWVATVAPKAIDELDLQGKVINVVFDFLPSVIKDIKQGKTLFSLDSQPYAQGYYTVVQLYNYITRGIQPFDMNTGGNFVINKENIDQYGKFMGK